MLAKPEITLILQLLDEAYDREAWHGTNVKGAVRRVDPKLALWRPGEGRHNIWELTVHIAYWKYAVRRRLRGDKRGSFPIKGSNWFDSPAQIGPREWKELLALLDDEHMQLCLAVERFSPALLSKTAKGSKFKYASLITGAAAHDLYHTGQIQLIKKLWRG